MAFQAESDVDVVGPRNCRGTRRRRLPTGPQFFVLQTARVRDEHRLRLPFIRTVEPLRLQPDLYQRRYGFCQDHRRHPRLTGITWRVLLAARRRGGGGGVGRKNCMGFLIIVVLIIITNLLHFFRPAPSQLPRRPPARRTRKTTNLFLVLLRSKAVFHIISSLSKIHFVLRIIEVTRIGLPYTKQGLLSLRKNQAQVLPIKRSNAHSHDNSARAESNTVCAESNTVSICT